jgi:hypothetical protein
VGESRLFEVVAKQWRRSPVIADHEAEVDGSQFGWKRNCTSFDHATDSVDEGDWWRRIERRDDSIDGECTSKVSPRHWTHKGADPPGHDESIAS